MTGRRRRAVVFGLRALDGLGRRDRVLVLVGLVGHFGDECSEWRRMWDVTVRRWKHWLDQEA